MTLSELRMEINRVDDQIMKLFIERMSIVDDIARLKKAEGLSIMVHDREKEVLERVLAPVSREITFYAASLYRHVLELSRERQREILSGGSTQGPISALLKSAKTPVDHPRVCVQGVEASFAMSAALRIYPDARLTYVDRWEDILYALADGSCDYGVMPVENSLAGTVGEVFDLLIKYRIYIARAVSLPVDHYLLGVRGAKLTDIRRVYSHPHAFPQCSEYLRKHPRFELAPYTNTAAAAEYVAREGKREYAAISSRDCAHLYGLDILAKSIQQSTHNCTRFISVARQPEIDPDANKVSLFFTLPHVTGSLYHTLARFAANGINISKIESRPNREHNFEYYFYLDFVGSVRSRPTLDLLNALSEELPGFHFLGNYCEPEVSASK